jgi:peptidoglycan/xylan/chitin deacetylase (PgdA/CDA1 family)
MGLHPFSRNSVVRGAAILAGAVLAFSAGTSAAQASPPIIRAAITSPPTVISLTFDDGNADQMTALPILDSVGMKGTFYITTGWTNYSGYMTQANLATLAAHGQEIGGHTVSHPDLTTLSTTEMTKQICQGRNTLAGWGFPTTSFAYPFASVNASVEAAVQACGFNSARNLGDTRTRFGGTAGLFAETMPPADPFQTRAPDEVDSRWTLADLKSAVTNAEPAGGWVQLSFHHVCATTCDPLKLSITPTLLQQFTSWLALRTPTASGSTSNTTVKTVAQVIGGAVKQLVPSTNNFAPGPGPGVNGIANPSLETAGGPGLPPQCFQPGGFGVSTPTFATVSTAHTGTVAEEVTVTGLVAGSSVDFLQQQDLGTCAPTATPGHSYSLRTWYTATTTTQFDVWYRNAVGGWIYWTSSPYFAASSTYSQAIWTTPAVPAGATGITFGLNLIQNGTLITDDYALYDSVGAPSTLPPAPGPGVNGIVNPSLEQAGTGGIARCWMTGGFGTNTAAFAVATPGRTGTVAERLTMTGYASGDAKLLPTMDLGECAPTVTTGHTYSLRTWYLSTAPTQFAVYLRNSAGVWSYWTSSPWFTSSSAYTQAVWQTSAIPAGYTGISFGLNLFQNGQLTTDDYALYYTVGAPTP